jgi:hypothetical protein
MRKFYEKPNSILKKLTARRIQKMKSANIPGQKYEILEGRTLFDDYFLAVLHGISIDVGSHIQNIRDIEIISDSMVNFSYEVVEAAMKKREEYFSEEKHERS